MNSSIETLIVDALLKVWPCIAMDAYARPDSSVPALHMCYVAPKTVRVLRAGGGPEFKTVYVANEDEIDGLQVMWPDFTYVNLPCDELFNWLLKARHEGQDREVAMIVPADDIQQDRYKDILATCAAIVDLDQAMFSGGLVVLYWGQNKAAIESAFEGLGTVREFERRACEPFAWASVEEIRDRDRDRTQASGRVVDLQAYRARRAPQSAS